MTEKTSYEQAKDDAGGCLGGCGTIALAITAVLVIAFLLMTYGG